MVKNRILLLCVCIFSISTHFFGQNIQYSRVLLKIEPPQLKEIAKLGIPTEGYFSNGGYVMELSEKELKALKKNGFAVNILIKDIKTYYKEQNKNFLKEKNAYCGASQYTTPSGFSLGSMSGFFTYNEILDNLDSMHTWYPHLISAKTPIDTFNTIEGRPVYWVRISNNPNTDQAKPKIFYNALIHAREPASMQQLIYFMYFVLENYNSHPDITNIVDNFELYFVPCANPDGYIYNELTDPTGGGMWRKNRRDNGNSTFGVDLNRNFGYMWGYDNTGSSPNGSNDTYRGVAAFSEPESRLLKSFCEQKNFSVALNGHTYSNLLLYPFGYAAHTQTPDSLTYNAFAQILTSENNYSFGTPFEVLGYLGNGDCGDWMYGEEQTKNKIISFSPEIGAPAFGFWPPMNEIINICNDNIKTNIYAAYLAGKYAEISDLTDVFIPSDYSYFKYGIQNLGLDSIAAFNVTLIPISSNITYAGPAKNYPNINHLQTQMDSIAIEIDNTVQIGEEIVFVVSVNNGSYSITDTIRKFAGQKKLIFYDDCSSMLNWQSVGWGVSTLEYYTPPSSINDSPLGNYQSNITNQITLSQPIDLTQTNAAILNFKAKWFLAYSLFGNYYDYVQLEISTDNGQTWTALCGKHSTPSYNSSIYNAPVYQTIQDSWVEEEISLNPFTGYNITFRFVLKSDWLPFTKDKGFYFDDFSVFAADSLIITKADIPITDNTFKIYPNPAQDFLFIEFSHSHFNLSIYNILGIEILKQKILDENLIKINTKSWSSGFYIIQIDTPQGGISKKIFLQGN